MSAKFRQKTERLFFKDQLNNGKDYSPFRDYIYDSLCHVKIILTLCYAGARQGSHKTILIL